MFFGRIPFTNVSYYIEFFTRLGNVRNIKSAKLDRKSLLRATCFLDVFRDS